MKISIVLGLHSLRATKRKTMVDTATPLRILCIHGYRQSAETCRAKLGALRKLFKKQVDLEFITAPHRVPPLPTHDPEEAQFGWWFCTPERQFNAKTNCDSSVGLEDSIKFVEEQFVEKGPFNGILGFSQGAAFVAILGAVAKSNPESPIKFDFAILFAGFKSLCVEHAKYYEPPKFSFPSLHVMGETDQVIEKELSEQLAECFENPEIFIHQGGHYVPATNQQKPTYLKFIQKQIKS